VGLLFINDVMRLECLYSKVGDAEPDNGICGKGFSMGMFARSRAIAVLQLFLKASMEEHELTR
jgi:hypothetical protein